MWATYTIYTNAHHSHMSNTCTNAHAPLHIQVHMLMQNSMCARAQHSHKPTKHAHIYVTSRCTQARILTVTGAMPSGPAAAAGARAGAGATGATAWGSGWGAAAASGSGGDPSASSNLCNTRDTAWATAGIPRATCVVCVWFQYAMLCVFGMVFF